MAEQLLTIKEMAKMLNISPRSIYNKTHRKSAEQPPVPVKRIGKAIRFRLSDVEAFILGE